MLDEVSHRQPAEVSSWSSWEPPPGQRHPRYASYLGRTRLLGFLRLLHQRMSVEQMRWGDDLVPPLSGNQRHLFQPPRWQRLGPWLCAWSSWGPHPWVVWVCWRRSHSPPCPTPRGRHPTSLWSGRHPQVSGGATSEGSVRSKRKSEILSKEKIRDTV